MPYLINVSPFTNICVNFHTIVTTTFEISFFSVDLQEKLLELWEKNHQIFETIKLKKKPLIISILFHWAFIHYNSSVSP
jgi:hypothetical protein